MLLVGFFDRSLLPAPCRILIHWLRDCFGGYADVVGYDVFVASMAEGQVYTVYLQDRFDAGVHAGFIFVKVGVLAVFLAGLLCLFWCFHFRFLHSLLSPLDGGRFRQFSLSTARLSFTVKVSLGFFIRQLSLRLHC